MENDKPTRQPKKIVLIAVICCGLAYAAYKLLLPWTPWWVDVAMIVAGFGFLGALNKLEASRQTDKK